MAGFAGMPVEWGNEDVIGMPTITDTQSPLSGFFRILLAAFLEAGGGGRVCSDPMLMKLAGISSRAPDLLVLLPEHEDRLVKNSVLGPADLVIEIISPV